MDPANLEDWGQRLRRLLIVVLALFGVLLLRLFYLQVTTSADYARESEENRIAQKRIKAPRGRILDRRGHVLAQNRASYTIIMNRTTAERDAQAAAALEEAIGGPPLRYTRKQPIIPLKRDVDFRTVCIVEERLGQEWSLDVEIEPQRDYLYGPLFAHLVGYMGELQEEELATPRPRRYTVGDYIGKTGVERVYEDVLRGDDGVRFIEVDARHRIKDEFPFPERERPARPGQDLVLTVDLDLQRAAYEGLPDSLAGSVVALDARTGAVLAMVSKPSFDPNAFVSFQAQVERRSLVQDGARPLLNRATQGQYPPGSTFKMVAAVAALEAGVTDTLSSFPPCRGSLEVGNAVFRCHDRDGHGALNLLGALEASCNVYFLHLGQVLGIEAWHDCAARFGFGQPTGLVLQPEEMDGLLPSRQYYTRGEGWAGGHLMNLVIGQGALLVTPVQMARYAAALANGGYLVTPHVRGPAPPPERIPGVSPATIDIVRRGMRRVV
ncbi:MAG: penicillin-binding protein 2, partial [Gemmatimonadota bacterium]